MNADTKRQLHKIAEKCIHLKGKERPEVIWLQEHHKKVQTDCGLKSKIDTDQLLYERMYQKKPEELHNLTKLRYWRTGRSVPGNRDQCLSYGQALCLSENELPYLIQAYYDHSITVYSPASAGTSPDYSVKYEKMIKLTEAYLEKIPSEQLSRFQIPSEKKNHYLRHLYFTDAFHYIHVRPVPEKVLTKHIVSTRYDSEFTRHKKLLGEIPRTVMIRHLLILGLPDITLKQLNEQLSFFGFLPLTESHTLVSGEYQDWLLIQLFQLYEKKCHSFSKEEKLLWFQNACRILDHYFIRTGHPKLRFMHFKALDL